MASTYYTVLTDIGAAKLANSQIAGIALKWTAMALGDGRGAKVTPQGNVTALKREVYRSSLNRLQYDANDPTQIIAEMVVLPQNGGYTIREVGIYDSDGDLVVYGNYPEVVVPKLAEGSGLTLTAVVRAAVGSNSNITLKIDPTSVIATREYVEMAIARLAPLDEEFSILSDMLLHNSFAAPLDANGAFLTDDNGNAVLADWKYKIV